MNKEATQPIAIPTPEGAFGGDVTNIEKETSLGREMTDRELFDTAFETGNSVIATSSDGELQADWRVDDILNREGSKVYRLTREDKEGGDSLTSREIPEDELIKLQGSYASGRFGFGDSVSVGLSADGRVVGPVMAEGVDSGWRIARIRPDEEGNNIVRVAKIIDGRREVVGVTEDFIDQFNPSDEKDNNIGAHPDGRDRRLTDSLRESGNIMLEVNRRQVENGVKSLKSLFNVMRPTYWAARNAVRQVERQEQLESMTPEDREASEKKRTRRKQIILGAVGLATTYLAMRGSIASPDVALVSDSPDLATGSEGFDFGGGFEEGSGGSDTTEDVKDIAEAEEQEEDLSEAEYSKEAETIDRSEGWYKTFAEMGILDEGTNWHDLLEKVGPELREMRFEGGTRVAYFDETANEWRMNMSQDAKMPAEVLDFIRDSAVKEGYIDVHEVAHSAQTAAELGEVTDNPRVPESDYSGKPEGGRLTDGADVVIEGDSSNGGALDTNSSATQPTTNAQEDISEKTDQKPVGGHHEPVGMEASANYNDVSDTSNWLGMESREASKAVVGSIADIGEWINGDSNEIQSGVRTADLAREYLNDRVGSMYSLGRFEETRVSIEEALRATGKTVENGVVK